MLANPLPGLQKATTDMAFPLGQDRARPLRRQVVHRFGGREVNPACRAVLVNGVQRRLQPKAFDLLIYLIDHRDRVLSIDELLNAVWYDRDVQVGSLATAIARVRAALGEGDGGGDLVIETHHRVGYRFVAALDSDVGVVS
jgi:DNA-binding winged helix-turn-helix (wHTH) protein